MLGRIGVFMVLCLFLPLSGCLGDDARPTVYSSLVFSFAAVERGDPSPVRVASCQALLTDLNQRALDEARVNLEQSIENDRRWGVGVAGAAEDSTSPASAPGQRAAASADASAAGAQVTGTNNQEAAADEGDLVKTDGEWTYVLSGGLLHILHSTHVGDVEPHARLDLGQAWGGDLVLARNDVDDPTDDRLLVVLPGQPLPSDNQTVKGSGTTSRDMAWYGGSATRLVVVSLADRSEPRIMKETLVEGSAMGTRFVAGVAYVVVHAYQHDLGLQTYVYPTEEDLRQQGVSPRIYEEMGPRARERILKDLAREADAENQARVENLTLSDHLPRIFRTQGGEFNLEPIDELTCSSFYTTPGTKGRGVTSVMATDLTEARLPERMTQVSGGSPTVYASGGALVLAAPSQDPWWFWAQPQLEEATDLQWFDLDGLEVRPRASGRVLGTVMDSFSLDVEGDELRVATTTGSWGRWWLDEPEPMMSHVAVFEEANGLLVETGIVGGIAPGERIWSARFTQERAYIVTFEQVDPLWVIDLSGAVPQILGELEIPGVSTYIHPLDEDALLTIGYGPGPGGQGLDWGRVQVSLFDISDVSNPRRADVIDLAPPGGWSSSGATGEHKAFTYWQAVGTLAVPLSSEGNGSGGRGYHVGLKLVDVDRERLDLTVRGEIDQDALIDGNASRVPEIERSYFLGYPETGPVSVYSVSALGVAAHDLTTLEAQGSVAFPERGGHYWYY